MGTCAGGSHLAGTKQNIISNKIHRWISSSSILPFVTWRTRHLATTRTKAPMVTWRYGAWPPRDSKGHLVFSQLSVRPECVHPSFQEQERPLLSTTHRSCSEWPPGISFHFGVCSFSAVVVQRRTKERDTRTVGGWKSRLVR